MQPDSFLGQRTQQRMGCQKWSKKRLRPVRQLHHGVGWETKEAGEMPILEEKLLMPCVRAGGKEKLLLRHSNSPGFSLVISGWH
jgi:hypothetical protein